MNKKTFLAIAFACVNIIFALAEDTDKKDKMNKITQTAGRAQLGNFAPDFAHFNDDVLFGENWNNTDIDLKTRSIITVVSLISLGITDNSLKYHLENAKKNGVSKTEIAAIITHNAFYAGWPKAWAAFNLAKSVWTDGTPAKSEKEAYAKTIMFPIGEPNNAYAKYFTGQSYLARISDSQVKIFNVTFEPKCRNNWHIHHAESGGGQILIGVGGRRVLSGMGKKSRRNQRRHCHKHSRGSKTLARRGGGQLVFPFGG